MSRRDERGSHIVLKPSEFGRVLFAEPLVPFRIHMAGGRTFDVWNPEFVRIGKS